MSVMYILTRNITSLLLAGKAELKKELILWILKFQIRVKLFQGKNKEVLSFKQTDLMSLAFSNTHSVSYFSFSILSVNAPTIYLSLILMVNNKWNKWK